MNLILTEEQSKRLINNIIDEQETLSKLSNLVNFFKGSKSDNFDSPTDGSPEFMGNIPSNIDMVHPLGKKYRISSKFGKRNTGISGASKFHKGVDISVPSGSPVYSPKDGKVEAARDTSPGNGCGGFIKINHGDIITKFCHLKQWVVNSGDEVKKGQLIGYSGGGKSDPGRGTSSGPHLHYEILNTSGIALNPTEVQNNLV